MKRRLVLLMLTSIVLNLVLVAIAFERATNGRSGSTALAWGDAPARPSAVSSPGTVDGSPPGDKIQILLELERRFLGDAERAARAYWKSSEEQEPGYGRSVLDAEDRIRAELVAIFGPAAAEDPAFRQLFRPLDPHYAFLSPVQQVAIQRLRYERDLKLRDMARQGAVPGAGRRIGADAARAISAGYREDLAALFDPATLFEFLLRDSPLAQQLRSSPVALSEGEFRAVFEVLWSLEDAAADIDAVLAARAELRGILGEARFARFWSARDPLYSRIEAAAARRGVDAAAVAAVYEVMVDFQDRQMRAARFAGSDPERAAAESRRLAEEERAGIARIVGTDLAAEILADRAAASFRLLDDPAAMELR